MEKSQAPTTSSFGEFFRQKRIGSGFTLRRFCERFGLDPAYISRVETDVLTPPHDKNKLVALAKALKIDEGSTEWVDFFDLAYLAKGKIPEDIMANQKSIKYLPLLFRTARGKKLSKKKLNDLVNLINNA